MGLIAGLSISNIGIVIIFISVVLMALPASPFTSFINSIDTIPYLSVINWILPIAEMTAILEAWLLAITAYYAISLLARWIKLIE